MGSSGQQRFENGESAAPERSNWLGRRVAPLDGMPEGTPRTALYGEMDEGQQVLRDLLAPFIEDLPAKYRDVLEAVYYERLSHYTLADRLGMSRPAVTRRIETAQRALMRAIALTNPDFEDVPHEGRGRPRRDYEAEEAAAWDVLTPGRRGLSPR